MYPESKPILIDTDKSFEEIEIYPIHDLHYGSAEFDAHRWNNLLNEILSKPNRFALMIGDLMDTALPNSKSNPLESVHSMKEQKDFVTEQFRALKDRILCIVDGNHEERVTRYTGLYTLYDSAAIVGIEDKYRSAYAVLDIGVGSGSDRHPDRPFRYVGYIVHKAKEMKNFSTADFLEGFDFVCFGHDHDPKDHSRGKLVYNKQRKTVSVKPIEVVNCGSFLNYGGYGAKGGYRPQSPQLYKLILSGRKTSIQTVGFYAD